MRRIYFLDSMEKTDGRCPSTWDGWQCWPKGGSPGQVEYSPCPNYIYFHSVDQYSCGSKSSFFLLVEKASSKSLLFRKIRLCWKAVSGKWKMVLYEPKWRMDQLQNLQSSEGSFNTRKGTCGIIWHFCSSINTSNYHFLCLQVRFFLTSMKW